MSKIDLSEVRRLAALARIGVSDQEALALAKELEQIVGFVEQLQSVDTTNVEITNQVTGLVDVWRPDKVAKSQINREQMLANAPDQQDGYIKVKRVAAQ